MRCRPCLLIIIILVLSFTIGGMIRLANLPFLEERYVLDPDSARYLRQAKLIEENGHLPDLDTMRWVPIGVQMKEPLIFFPVLIAFLHRGASFFFHSLTVEQVAILSPIFLSILSALALYFLLSRALDRETALFGVNIALVAYPWVRRTVAGYADWDALSLFLALVSFYFYLRSFQASTAKRGLIFALLSGNVMVLLGLTWEGVGLMSAVIISVEFIQFIGFKYEKQDVYRYLSWGIPVLLGLTVCTNVYRDLSRPYSLLALGVPALFLLFALMFLILRQFAGLLRVITLNHQLPVGLSRHWRRRFRKLMS